MVIFMQGKHPVLSLWPWDKMRLNITLQFEPVLDFHKTSHLCKSVLKLYVSFDMISHTSL